MEAHRDDADRRVESDAILRRVREETEPQVGAAMTRMGTDLRGHFRASDVDQEDRIEVLGTRIGRLAGLAIFVALVAMLLVTILVP